jgi:hypothetical protein
MKIKTECLALAISLALLSTACTQASPKPTPANQSKPLTNGTFAYDDAHRVVVLVTSNVPRTGVLQTWTWDGRSWAHQAPVTSPPAREYALLAYDESRRVMVLQGGTTASAPLADTWEWNGSNWSQRKPAHSPSVGQPGTGSLAYDPASKRMFLYQFPQETWRWEANDWTKLQPAHVPDLLDGTLVYDGQRLLLIGGSPDGDGIKTWGWNGSDWTLLATRQSSPSPFVPAAFNAGRHQVVVYGGGPGDDTWGWDGTRWGREHPKHSPPGNVTQLVYDKALNRLITIARNEDLLGIAGIYGWDGSDWSALGPDSPPAVAAGKGTLPAGEALATIRRTVTRTAPILLPKLPSEVNQAIVTADANGFSMRAMNDVRSSEVSVAIVIPGNSNLGAANKNIPFRHGSAYYQYIATNPTGWRSLWWVEQPGYWPESALNQTGVPYLLSATGLTEAQFFALAGSLR